MNTKNNKELRVLIADDEAAIIRVYSIGLRHHFSPDEKCPPVDISVCQQGSEAVRLAREACDAGTPFNIIVLDIRMPPGISGVEAAQQIRHFDQTVPFLFLSGFSDYAVPDLEKSVPPASLMNFMQKPVQLAELAQQIRQTAGYQKIN